MNLFEKLREALESTRMRGFALFPLRLVIGYGFLAHGLAKLHKGADAFATILQATGGAYAALHGMAHHLH